MSSSTGYGLSLVSNSDLRHCVRAYTTHFFLIVHSIFECASIFFVRYLFGCAYISLLALSFFTTAHIFGVMDTSDPARFNEQHIWGGNTFHRQNSFNSDASGQLTLVGQHEPVAAVSGSTSSQTRIIASSSDDLFHPASGGPPSHSYFFTSHSFSS